MSKKSTKNKSSEATAGLSAVLSDSYKITKAIKAGAKEVITPKDEYLQYDRFKFRTADIPYHPNHSYSIGRVARTILDEYSKMLGARVAWEYESGKVCTYTDADKLPPWIREFTLANTCHTKPFIVGRDFYYVYDIEDVFEWKFFGGPRPLWD